MRPASSSIERLQQDVSRVAAQVGNGGPAHNCFDSLTCEDRSHLAEILGIFERDPAYLALPENDQRKILYATLSSIPGNSGARLRANFWQGEMARMREARGASATHSSPASQPLRKAADALESRTEAFLTELGRYRGLSTVDTLTAAYRSSSDRNSGGRNDLEAAAENYRASARILEGILRAQRDSAAPDQRSEIDQALAALQTQNETLGAQTRLVGAEFVSTLKVIRANVRVLRDLILTVTAGGGAGRVATLVSGAGWSGLLSNGASAFTGTFSDEGYWCSVAESESLNQSPILGDLAQLGTGALGALGLTAVVSRLGSSTLPSALKLTGATTAATVAGAAIVATERERSANLTILDAALETSTQPDQTRCLQAARAQIVAGRVFDVGALLLGFTGFGQPRLDNSSTVGSASLAALASTPARARALAIASEAIASGKLSVTNARRFILEATDLYGLRTPAELRRLAEVYEGAQNLPRGHFVERIIPGSAANKVALIGRGHDGVLNAEQALLAQNPALEVQTFHPSEAALSEWRRQLENLRATRGVSAELTREEVQATRLFQENVTWIEGLRSQGVTVLDIGNTFLNPSPGYFYEAETRILFGPGR